MSPKLGTIDPNLGLLGLLTLILYSRIQNVILVNGVKHDLKHICFFGEPTRTFIFVCIESAAL